MIQGDLYVSYASTFKVSCNVEPMVSTRLTRLTEGLLHYPTTYPLLYKYCPFHISEQGQYWHSSIDPVVKSKWERGG